MKFSLVTTIRNLSLKKTDTSDRNKKVCNLLQAEFIGFFSSNPTIEHFNLLECLKSEFAKRDKKIEILYFWNDKKIPDYLSNVPYLFSKKHLNFWGVPKSEMINEFCEQPFDIFVDFSTTPDFYSKFIAQNSESTFKVGLHIEENLPYFDLLIKGKDGESFEEHVKHIIHYLTIINTVNHEG